MIKKNQRDNINKTFDITVGNSINEEVEATAQIPQNL